MGRRQTQQRMASITQLLQTPEPHGHFVQLCGNDPRSLICNVVTYISEGLKQGDGVLVVATPENTAGFLSGIRDLGVDPESAIRESRLVLLDAHQTLGTFMMNGQPDFQRFERVITAAISRVDATRPNSIRAYGEMVGILWRAGNYTAAIRLEEYWNELLQSGRFTLFCSYPIDVFADDFQISGVDALLCDHTHLIPNGESERMKAAVDQAIDDYFGERANGLKLGMANDRFSWAEMPEAEAMILWIRNNLPREANDVINLARKYYTGASSTCPAPATPSNHYQSSETRPGSMVS